MKTAIAWLSTMLDGSIYVSSLTKMCLFCPYIYSNASSGLLVVMLNSRFLTLWMAASVLLVHHHLSHQHLPPYRWGELKHEHKTGVLGVSELPLKRSVPTKLYTSFQSHQFHSVHNNVSHSVPGDEFFLITPSQISVPIL